MTALAVAHQCRLCPTIIPPDRELCYFHSRPAARPTPRLDRLEHVRSHLFREEDRAIVAFFLEPLTVEEIAARMGPGWGSGAVDYAWGLIRADMGLRGGMGRTATIDRIALLRIVAGMDPCFCES